MDPYDRDYGRSFGRSYGYSAMDYGHDYQQDYGHPNRGFSMRERNLGWGGARESAGFMGRGVGLYRSWGTASEAPRRGYDRGVYGGDYPTYGGYPGDRQEGMYYGGSASAGHGYDRGYGRGRPGRYDQSFAREPFMPEAAYDRHPEYDRPQENPTDRWPAMGHMGSGEMDDREIRRAVRENLHQDSWVEPGSIDVSVQDGVVTLRGEVSDYMEARYAWDDAWETDGVRGVVNQLTVRIAQSRNPHGDVLPQTAGGEQGRGR